MVVTKLAPELKQMAAHFNIDLEHAMQGFTVWVP